MFNAYLVFMLKNKTKLFIILLHNGQEMDLYVLCSIFFHNV